MTHWPSIGCFSLLLVTLGCSEPGHVQIDRGRNLRLVGFQDPVYIKRFDIDAYDARDSLIYYRSSDWTQARPMNASDLFRAVDTAQMNGQSSYMGLSFAIADARTGSTICECDTRLESGAVSAISSIPCLRR